MYPGELAKTFPDKAAYVMAASGETVTFKQLDEASNRGAQLFRSLGLQAGDHVAIHMENNARFFEICWAAQRSGIISTAISSRLTAPAVEYIVSDCGARAYIGSQKLRDVAEQLREPLSGLDGRFLVGGAIDGYLDWGDSTRIIDVIETLGRHDRQPRARAHLRRDRRQRHVVFLGNHGAPEGRVDPVRRQTHRYPTGDARIATGTVRSPTG